MIDGVWVHLSAGLGNHFFVRAELYEEFVRIFRESKAESLCVGAIPAALEVMKGLSSPDGAPPPSSSTNPTSDRLD